MTFLTVFLTFLELGTPFISIGVNFLVLLRKLSPGDVVHGLGLFAAPMKVVRSTVSVLKR